MHFTVLPAQRSPAACSGLHTNQMAVAAGEQPNMQSSRWSSPLWFVSPAICPGAAPPWEREQRPGDGAGAAEMPRSAMARLCSWCTIEIANEYQA